MKDFKKRTIALILASVVSIAGSFATENYKNSLLGLKFEAGENNATGVKMVLETKTPYTEALSLSRRGTNTYVIILKEVDANLKSPDLTKAGGHIADVDIGTLPYTTNGVGYTKVTVKTVNPIEIVPQNKIFIADKNSSEQIRLENIERESREQENINREKNDNRIEDYKRSNIPVEKEKTNTPIESSIEQASSNTAINDSSNTTTSYAPEKESPLMLILGAILIIAFSAYMYVRAKNKLTDLTGENISIDFSDDTEEDAKKKDSKTKQIKNSIKNIDKKYPNKPVVNKKPVSIKTTLSQPIKKVSTEDLNVVDLDALFQETTKTNLTSEEEENLALEDFLSGFSFNEHEVEDVVEDAFLYDEEYLEKVLNHNDLKFTKDDIEKLNKLLLTEISDETIRNLDKFLVSNPIKKKPTQQEVLEDFVTTYSVSNNITFTKDDINALNQIITVELDKDFVTDLRTNPKRTAEVTKEISEPKEIKRETEEIKTLNVKKFLPDLTEEIKKQPEIKSSNYKPSVLELDANCEVEALSVDLDIDFTQPQTPAPKPQEIKVSETAWETSTLQIADALPDLQDALLHPEKYEKPKQEQPKADESVLLNNLTNLSFKPFDDGTREFEVLNDLNDMEPEEDDVVETLTLSEIQKELMDLGQTLEIAEPEVNPAYIMPSTKKSTGKEDVEPETMPTPAINKKNVPTRQAQEKSHQVQKIKTQKDVKRIANKVEQKNNTNTKTTQATKCLWENQAFSVIQTVNFSTNTGCHLAKNESGYVVLGFIGDRLFKLKDFYELKSENIQARLSEKLDNKHSRYLVRIGIIKFVIDVSDETMQHVLDL